MTALDFSTTPRTILQPSLTVAAPDWGANVAASGRAGDYAYAFAQRAGASLPEQAVAYHVAFAETMHELGTPMPCPCDLCNAHQEVTQ